jgi:hypothetical protein
VIILLWWGPAILLVGTNYSTYVVGQIEHREYVFFRRVLELFWMLLYSS